ncbi:Detected protein of unknown function [Hibiscus syriacus]|uniref:TF-B3 domain-containing protein n=1 Tax=Hibiscus syriacus TaxID=106335 RepID=A0A6A2WA90_HIBSY|nr:Detected protein of unknown function [Hibiscus syriacus]
MAVEVLFVKTLTKTDKQKRLSVPTKKKICFLDFEDGYTVEFRVMDDDGRVWTFVCSKRKKNGYPKPVFSKGWLQFVRCWKLEIGDKVMVYRLTVEKGGEGQYRIRVIRREPLAHADKAMAVTSYTDDEDEATTTSSDSTNAMTDQHGFMFEFISLKPDIAVSERKFVGFIELGSREGRENDHHLCILTL